MESANKILLDKRQFWKGEYLRALDLEKHNQSYGSNGSDYVEDDYQNQLKSGEQIADDGNNIKGNMVLVLFFKSNRTVQGRGINPSDSYSITGTHNDLQSVKLNKKGTDGSTEIKFSGDIHNDGRIEGKISGETEGTFKLQLDTDQNAELTQLKLEVDEPFSFSGIREADGRVSLVDLRVNFSSTGKISGKGTDDSKTITIRGEHQKLENIILKVQFEDNSEIEALCQVVDNTFEGAYKIDGEDRKIILWKNS